MRALVNSAADPGAVPRPVTDALEFHRALPGYRPTPVRRLPELAKELGVADVLVKDESDRLGMPAFKILGASWAAERALPDAPETHTLVAASAGNHGRAVARVAAMRGLRCRIFLPERSLPARREAIAREGAEVVVGGVYEDAVAAAERAGAEPGLLLVSDVGDSGPARWVIDGYATLFAEAAAAADYDVILVPVGVGSLGAAAARHAAEVGATTIAVEPEAAACLTASLEAGAPTTIDNPGTIMAGLDCAEVSLAAWDSLRSGIRGTITVGDDEARRAMDELAGWGLAIGESGASTLAALRALVLDPEAAPLREAVGIGPGSRVLLIASEGVTAGTLAP